MIIPQFFGFVGVGILFRDKKLDCLFSVDSQEFEEDGEIVKQKELRKKKNEELTHDEKLQDVERQYRKRGERLKFPHSIGMTGQAYHSG